MDEDVAEACNVQTSDQDGTADSYEIKGENATTVSRVEFHQEGYPAEYFCTTGETNCFPLDLTIPKVQSLTDFTRPLTHQLNTKREVISVADLLGNFYCDESYLGNTSRSSSGSNNYSFNSFEETSYEEFPAGNDFVIHQQAAYAKVKHNYCESRCSNQDFWSVGTNTEPKFLVDTATQTVKAETMDKSVQTDYAPNIMVNTVIKTEQKKFSCSFCRRVYASKNGYDRHLRSHLVVVNNEHIISNVRVTTDSKVQIYNKQVTQQARAEPIIIQMPRNNTFQYEPIAQKLKEEHNENCVVEPFLMNKCPECSVKFYTVECLNKHISMVHKKSAYYCIFCNEHFDAAFSFQLHLDKHVTP